ncbi:MAG: radical SAM protein, partial [Gemmatimonadetes bacterium]|nr:radical SAM protein [Gemmatimonadota bacterium]
MSIVLQAAKFQDPDVTATGAQRAFVDLVSLNTLWFNTGTLCNIECHGCYIESSPVNDRLSYIRASEVETYLDEIAELGWSTEEIGFTGGEPFMNPEIVEMVGASLGRGFRVLILTNAMQPM